MSVAILYVVFIVIQVIVLTGIFYVTGGLNGNPSDYKNVEYNHWNRKFSKQL